MIDLHCHLLPGIDDGAKDLATSLEMARMAVADGIHKVYCTPHIYPGLYENVGPDIVRRVAALQQELERAQIALQLSYGADTHLVPEVPDGLHSGRIPTLGGSRYALIEPAHTIRPPRFLESVFDLIALGYVPIITHPERLTWVAEHYDDFLQLAHTGAWLQVTGGSLLGKFGKRPQLFAERFVGDGWCAVLASDGHTTGRRAPLLAEAAERAGRLAGSAESRRMIATRPAAVCGNTPAHEVPLPPALTTGRKAIRGKIGNPIFGWFRR